MVDAEGHTLEILSTLSQANRDADARAFAAVMKHIREVDSKDHTVIAIQVENEVGLLSSSRDYCPAANDAFAKPVPRELTDYLQQNKDNLLPELKKVWDAAGSKTAGTWEEVFGKNIPSPCVAEERLCASPSRQARRGRIVQPRRRDFHGVELRPLHRIRRRAGQEGIPAPDVRQRLAGQSDRSGAGRLSQRRAGAAGA